MTLLTFFTISWVIAAAGEAVGGLTFVFVWFHSEILGVVTLVTILSSMSAGKVHPSDAITKVPCKPFKQVRHSILYVCALSAGVQSCHIHMPSLSTPLLPGASD